MQKYNLIALLILFLMSCDEQENRSDAYGNFEATDVLVSTETAGRLIYLKVREGETIKQGELVAIIDTAQLHLQRKLVDANIGTLPKKLQNSLSEIEVLEQQKLNLIRERDRVARLLEKKAATSKQLDDMNGEIAVIEDKVSSIQTQTQIANRSILAAKEPLLAQKSIINDQIRRSYIYNPIQGTVLTQLSEASEMVNRASPLYRIAFLDTLSLRFYVSNLQLQNLKIGQEIEVLLDKDADSFLTTKGKISWIANQAEFTPKTIQTKEDRINLVYAIEALVANPDGLLKIGMPAEVNFAISN